MDKNIETGQPLLSDESEPVHKLPQRREWLSTRYIVVIVLVLLACNAVLQILTLATTSNGLIYSPANEVLSYVEQHAWDRGDSSQYLHGTQIETDEAWKDLMHGVNIRVSKEDMQKTQAGFDNVQDAVQITDGDYVGVLGVYHSLHCLNLLRVVINQNAYNLTQHEVDANINLDHLQHCIDFLRSDVMCHADLTVYRGTWLRSSKALNSKRIRSTSKTRCANWGPIKAWVDDRALEPHGFKVRPGPYEKHEDEDDRAMYEHPA